MSHRPAVSMNPPPCLPCVAMVRCRYYETIAGGAGAGPTWSGCSGVHTHMTNTRITDPEILERRYITVPPERCLVPLLCCGCCRTVLQYVSSAPFVNVNAVDHPATHWIHLATTYSNFEIAPKLRDSCVADVPQKPHCYYSRGTF